MQIPKTKEVVSALPQLFGALCMNTRGLDAFLAYRPFDHLYRLVLEVYPSLGTNLINTRTCFNCVHL